MIGPLLKKEWDSIIGWVSDAMTTVHDTVVGAFTRIVNWFSSSWMGKMLHLNQPQPVNRPAPSAAAAAPSSYVLPKQQSTVHVTTQLNVDGRRIASTVTQHQAKSSSNPFTGPGNMDWSMAAPMPGM